MSKNIQCKCVKHLYIVIDFNTNVTDKHKHGVGDVTLSRQR